MKKVVSALATAALLVVSMLTNRLPGIETAKAVEATCVNLVGNVQVKINSKQSKFTYILRAAPYVNVSSQTVYADLAFSSSKVLTSTAEVGVSSTVGAAVKAGLIFEAEASAAVTAGVSFSLAKSITFEVSVIAKDVPVKPNWILMGGSRAWTYVGEYFWVNKNCVQFKDSAMTTKGTKPGTWRILESTVTHWVGPMSVAPAHVIQ